MATSAKPNSSRLSSQKVENGKLADAIYRNNTTFRKQLEVELQKIDHETAKSQRNLEQSQLAFRNKIKAKQQQWLKQQEKNYEKMYHYVYNKKNEEDNATNVQSSHAKNGQNRISAYLNNSEFDDIVDYDDFYDDDNESAAGDEGSGGRRKPVLLLMDSIANKKATTVTTAPVKAQQQQQQQSVSILNRPKLVREKTMLQQSNSSLAVYPSVQPNNLDLLLPKRNSVANTAKLLANFNQSTHNFGQTSRKTAVHSLFKSSSNNTFMPIKTSTAESIATTTTTRLQPPNRNNNESSLSSISGIIKKTDELSRLSLSNSQTKFYSDYDGSDFKMTNPSAAILTSSSSSFMKLPSFIKEYKIDIHRSKHHHHQQQHQQQKELEDTFVRSYELIDAKHLKTPILSIYSKPIIQHQKTNDAFKLASTAAVSNKQKFENRIRSSFLKRNQHAQIQKPPVDAKVILNDERFVNLVSTLGSQVTTLKQTDLGTV